MRRLVLPLAAAVCLSAPAEAQSAKGAKPTWLTGYADAQAAAKKSGKPIVIDAGREA